MDISGAPDRHGCGAAADALYSAGQLCPLTASRDDRGWRVWDGSASIAPLRHGAAAGCHLARGHFSFIHCLCSAGRDIVAVQFPLRDDLCVSAAHLSTDSARKSDVSGKSVSVRVVLVGRRIIKKKLTYKLANCHTYSLSKLVHFLTISLIESS